MKTHLHASPALLPSAVATAILFSVSAAIHAAETREHRNTRKAHGRRVLRRHPPRSTKRVLPPPWYPAPSALGTPAFNGTEEIGSA
jgi:hypothetical protein